MRKSVLASIVIAASMTMAVNAAPFETQAINVGDKLSIDLPAEWKMEEQETTDFVTDYLRYKGDDVIVFLQIFDTEATETELGIEDPSIMDFSDMNYSMIDGFFSADFDNNEYEMIETHDCGAQTLTGTAAVATGVRDGEDCTGYIYACYNSGLWYYVEFYASCDVDSDESAAYKELLEDFMTTAHPTIINGDVYDDADTVRKVQEELSNYGHPCTADGVMGPGTAKELKAYQADNMLSVNGVITDEVLESLEIIN